MTNQPFPVLYAGDFMRKADRVLSVLKNLDLGKTITSQLMTPAACMEVAEFNECLKATQVAELKTYTGNLLQCTPTLDTYIERFKKMKDWLYQSYNPDSIWPEGIQYSDYIEKEEFKNAHSTDLNVLECIKKSDIVDRIQCEENDYYSKYIWTDDGVQEIEPRMKGEPRNFREEIDTWANSLRPNISILVYILLYLCKDTIAYIIQLKAIVDTPSADALARGMEQMFSSYLAYYWMEEQAKIETDIELLLREYDEEDKEGITNALIEFYEDLREDKKPFPQDYSFVQLWHKHLSKAKTPETYLAFAEEMLFKWNAYKSFFKDGVLSRCFYEIQIDEYISYELRELRKSGRKKHQYQTKESNEILTDIPDTEQELINKLVPLFNSEEEAKKFPNRIKGLDDKKITKLVNQLWEKGVIADTTTKQDLWQVLHDARLYTKGISTWNGQVNKPPKRKTKTS